MVRLLEGSLQPVETEGGEEIGQYAISHLSTRYQVLLDRASRRPLSPSEDKELRETQRAIESLQGMAPTGLLIPSRKWPWLDQGAPEVESPM